MPAANGTLSNCVRLTVEGKLIGYFRDNSIAYHWLAAYRRIYLSEGGNIDKVEYKIEPWFIEGEF